MLPDLGARALYKHSVMDTSSPLVDSTNGSFFVRSCAYAALTLTLWEWITTLDFEIQTIWDKRTDWRIRWPYIASRYTGLVSHIANSFIVSFVTFDTQEKCRIWCGFELALGQTVRLCLETILVHRLCALYNRRRNVTKWVTVGLSIQAVVITVQGTFAIRTLKFYTFQTGCKANRMPLNFVSLAAIQMVSQVLIWALTLYKYMDLQRSSGWQTIPVLSLVARDGSWVFVSSSILLVAAIVEGLRRGSPPHAVQLSHVLFPIYITITSISSCRITMNIRRSTEDSVNDATSLNSGSIQLTSWIPEFT